MPYKISERVSWKEMNGFAVVVDTVTGEYYSLNRPACLIWQGLAEGKDPQAIGKQLSTEYEVDETQARQDIRACIAEWLGYGILQTADAFEP
jgi:hypothetical protein